MANNVVLGIVIIKYSFFKEATTLLTEKLLLIFSWKKLNLSPFNEITTYYPGNHHAFPYICLYIYTLN
jgi:hypothetical protein